MPDLLIYSSKEGTWTLGALASGPNGVDGVTFTGPQGSAFQLGSLAGSSLSILPLEVSGRSALLVCPVDTAAPEQAPWWFRAYTPATATPWSVAQVGTGLPIGPTPAQAQTTGQPRRPATSTTTLHDQRTTDHDIAPGVVRADKRPRSQLRPIISKRLSRRPQPSLPEGAPVWWASSAAFMGTFTNGLVASSADSPPPSIAGELEGWSSASTRRRVAWTEQLANYAQDIPGSWSTTSP